MRAALFGFLLVATAACSDNPGPAAQDGGSTAEDGAPLVAAAGSKACDVLTQADAAKALGRQVEKLENDGGPAALDFCQYGYQGERMMDAGNVSVTVQPLDLASVKSGAEAQGYKLEPIAGVGDVAYYSPDIGLYAGKGNMTAIYLVGVGGEDAAKAKERAVGLARDTVGRL